MHIAPHLAVLPLALVAATLSACSSSADSKAQTPVEPRSSDPISYSTNSPETANAVTEGILTEMTEAPPQVMEEGEAPDPWTGAYSETAIMLSRHMRIEGPEGLLDHVLVSSDDEFFERTLEVTPAGLLQTVRRSGEDAPEIRIRIDGWSLAAEESVTILERVEPGPVRVIGSGNALWRDINGGLAQADRLEFVGEIGDDEPVRPASIQDRDEPQNDGDVDERNGEASEDEMASPMEENDDATGNDPSGASTSEIGMPVEVEIEVPAAVSGDGR